MVWFKVDDGMHAHPKTLAAGNAAIGLWTVCGSWSSNQLTEGFVPEAMALRYGTRAQCRALVTAGLWSEVEGGYQFHDFDEYNPSADAVQADRAAAAERQRRARGKAKSQRESRRDGGVTHGVSNGEVRAQSRSPRPDPTRPDPNKHPPGGSDAAAIVAAYVEGARSIGAPDPDGSLCARVGKQAKAMLRSHDQGRLEDAAFSMGAQGWHDLAVEIQRGAANGRPAPNRTTERLNQGLAVVRKLEAQARGELA